MFHTLILAGNVGGEPSMRFTPAGKSVTSFSVAVSDGFGDKQHTIWFRVSAWDKLAETCNQYLHKGSKVLIEGRLIADKETGTPRIFTRQDGTTSASYEINATTVRFLSNKNETVPSDENSDANSEIPF